VLLLLLIATGILAEAPTAQAGPVDWREVAASDDGRQWWDAGSLRLNRNGRLTVLSRFQPSDDAGEGSESGRASGGLYVMELDCEQELYRDTSVNGLPRWGTAWQPSGGDSLTAAVVRDACLAGAGLLAGTVSPP
jgi:hypothetical protein